jgi:hypothetical protein
MGRAIVAVVVGYLVMFVVVFATFSAAYILMGVNKAFQPGTYDVTALWLVTSFALSLLAAVGGGFVCAAIARSGRAPFALAASVLVLGLVFAVPVIMASQTEKAAVRTGDVGNLEAMQNAKQPVWVALATPFVGVAGVLLGAQLKRKLQPG